jgi:hypothetical protein
VSDPAVSWPAKAGRFMLHEVKLVLPPTIYFLFAFNFIVFTTNLMTRPYWFTLEHLFVATTLALVVGKVILVADKFSLGRRYHHRPMIQTIVYRTIFYTLVVGLVRAVEAGIHLEFDHRGFSVAWAEAANAFTWKRFIGVQVWLMVCFALYVTVTELNRRLGPGRLTHLLFRHRQDISQPTRQLAE